jgi:hypothetical protein
MERSKTARRRSRLALFVVLVTAVVVWALTQKGLVALPLLVLYAAPHLFSAVAHRLFTDEQIYIADTLPAWDRQLAVFLGEVGKPLFQHRSGNRL